MKQLVSVVSLSLAVLLLAGCAVVDGKVSQRGSGVKWKIAKKKNDRYVQAVSKLKSPLDPAGQQGAVLRYERPLSPPLRVEACLGAKDEKSAARLEGNGRFSIELALPGAFPPTEFYSVVVLRTSGGMQTFGATHLSGSAIGNEFFAGADLLYVAVDHDGSEVRFEARASETDAWTLIGSVAAAGQTFPVYPTLGVFQVTKPGKVAFDDLRVVRSGVAGATGLALAVQQLHNASDDALSAMFRLEKDAPDRTEAGSEIDAAIQHVTDAIAEVQGALVPKRRSPGESALKSLEKGRKKLEKAKKKIEKGKPGKSVNKQIEKALKKLYQGGELLQGLL